MMKWNGSFVLLLTCFLSLHSRAGDGDFAVSRISPALLKNAHVIKRLEQIQFEVISTGEAILHKKYALTIMDESGDDAAGFVEYYDKLHDIRNIEGTLFDANGRELKRLRNKQIIDASGSDDNNLADGSRRKYHHFFYRVYPYTVQYEVDIRYNGTLFFPVWLPREGENFSVEQSSISVTSDPSYTVRYKAINYNGDPVITTGKNTRTLTWQVQGLPAIEREYASPDWLELNTEVFLGPTQFEIEKYKGNMNSWLEFGKFVHSLKQGRDQLPEKVQQVVHQLADAQTTTRGKIAALYEYLQKNTRYISIQLGIGGWQPFDATYVATRAYGDCKALTNFMYSLLKEADIPSYYALVKSGRNARDLIVDFPSQQFDHVILCVPNGKDTMWLECTSQTVPAGYLGNFTSNRYALLVSEKGGELVRTPTYKLEDNLQVRTIRADLSPDASLQVNVETRYGGLQQDDIHSLINNLSKDKVKEYLHQELDFATYDVDDFSYQEMKAAIPVIDEKLSINVRSYAAVTGKRLFIVPNIMTRSNAKITPGVPRNYDMVFRVPYADIDTVEIHIPEGYVAESMPADVSLKSPFGSYRCSVKLVGNTLYYYRHIERYAGRFAPSEYDALANFLLATYKADRNKVVLVKNN